MKTIIEMLNRDYFDGNTLSEAVDLIAEDKKMIALMTGAIFANEDCQTIDL
jgi:hypothetical protein